jgi:hypothetical protein
MKTSENGGKKHPLIEAIVAASGEPLKTNEDGIKLLSCKNLSDFLSYLNSRLEKGEILLKEVEECRKIIKEVLETKKCEEL